MRGGILLGVAVSLLSACGGAERVAPPVVSTQAEPAPVVAPEPQPVGPTLPTALPELADGHLPAPMMASLLGVDAEGKLLVNVTAIFPSDNAQQASSEYVVVLEPHGEHLCTAETVRAVSSALTNANASPREMQAALRQEDARRELDRLRALARRFSVSSLHNVLFDAGSDIVVVGAQGRSYVVHGDRVSTAQRESIFGTSFSPDRRWVSFAGCRGACSRPRIAEAMHAGTLRQQQFPRGLIHDMFWSFDNTLYFSYDDTQRDIDEASRVCLGHLDPSRGAAEEVRCIESRVFSTELAVASPDRRYIAIQTVGGSGQGNAVHVMQLPEATDLFAVPGQPTRMAIDNRGNFAWTDPRRRTTHITTASHDQLVANSEVVGFVRENELVVFASDFNGTLAERPCDLFSIVRATH